MEYKDYYEILGVKRDAIQAFTIFLYGNSIGLFIIMLLALIVQVFSVYDNKKK